HVDTRRRTCALAVIRVLSAGVLHRRYRSRGLLREGETCEGRIALTFEPANLVGGGAVSNRPQFSPSTHYYCVTDRAFAKLNGQTPSRTLWLSSCRRRGLPSWSRRSILIQP